MKVLHFGQAENIRINFVSWIIDPFGIKQYNVYCATFIISNCYGSVANKYWIVRFTVLAPILMIELDE